MEDIEIFQAVVDKAIKNGLTWRGDKCIYTRDGAFGIELCFEEGLSHLFPDTDSYLALIYDHDFAKSYWGEEDNNKGDDWAGHLKKMIMEKDKLQYLKSFL